MYQLVTAWTGQCASLGMAPFKLRLPRHALHVQGDEHSRITPMFPSSSLSQPWWS